MLGSSPLSIALMVHWYVTTRKLLKIFEAYILRSVSSEATCGSAGWLKQHKQKGLWVGAPFLFSLWEKLVTESSVSGNLNSSSCTVGLSSWTLSSVAYFVSSCQDILRIMLVIFHLPEFSHVKPSVQWSGLQSLSRFLFIKCLLHVKMFKSIFLH